MGTGFNPFVVECSLAVFSLEGRTKEELRCRIEEVEEDIREAMIGVAVGVVVVVAVVEVVSLVR